MRLYSLKGFAFVSAFNILLSANVGLSKIDKDDGLPFEPNTKIVKIGHIPLGNVMNLEYVLSLPKTQKLNSAAPSAIEIYEKLSHQKWSLTSRIDLNEVLNVNDEIQVSRTLNLRYPDSEVTIFSTIYHCGKNKNTACYIQGFKASTSRAKASQKASNTVPFYISGTME